jgi:hypothetical protein
LPFVVTFHSSLARIHHPPQHTLLALPTAEYPRRETEEERVYFELPMAFASVSKTGMEAT